MTAQKSGLNKIVEKIRALIRHQQSAQKIGSLNEADAFAAKIQELCNKRRLSVAEMGKEEVASAITFTNFIPEEHSLKALHKAFTASCQLGVQDADGIPLDNHYIKQTAPAQPLALTGGGE